MDCQKKEKTMSIIYEPKGRAREYAPLAANLYTGCSHGCKYCYVPKIMEKSPEEYRKAEPRQNVLEELEKDCKKYYASDRYVQLSFVGDPYDPADQEFEITRLALKLFLNYKIPVSILTKGGSRVLRDIDIFEQFGKHIIVGQTLTFWDKEKSVKWEPFAAFPQDRIHALRILKQNGIRTWASFEPVIEPEETLKVMEHALPYLDYVKVGKINHFEEIEKRIDWHKFAIDVIRLLNESGKPFYLKRDLREIAGVEDMLTPEQKDPDGMKVKPFPHDNKFDDKKLTLF